MGIYFDIIFLINFVMNFFVLFTVSKLAKKRISKKRLLLSAAISALTYCICIAVLPYKNSSSIIVSFVVISFGIVFAFYPFLRKEFFKLIFMTYIITFAIGGIGIFIVYYTTTISSLNKLISFSIENVSVAVLITAICISYILLKIVSYYFDKIFLHKQEFCDFIIFFDDKQAQVKGLVDTGNSLIEPISGAAVIVCEFTKIEKCLPDLIGKLYIEHKEDDMSAIIESFTNSGMSPRIRLVPFSSIGRENGVLIGFKPDKIEIIEDKKNIILTNVVIGICNFKLSSENNYHALINPRILTDWGD